MFVETCLSKCVCGLDLKLTRTRLNQNKIYELYLFQYQHCRFQHAQVLLC
ncbi:hypothetical protein Hanom_Chr01g00047611 [Helianthus anomalus]